MGFVTDLGELLPGDEPRALDRLVSDGMVATDRQANPAHVLVVRGDDVLESDLVPSSSGRECVALLSGRHPCQRLDTSYPQRRAYCLRHPQLRGRRRGGRRAKQPASPGGD